MIRVKLQTFLFITQISATAGWLFKPGTVIFIVMVIINYTIRSITYFIYSIRQKPAGSLNNSLSINSEPFQRGSMETPLKFYCSFHLNPPS